MNDPSTILISGALAVSRDDVVAEALRLGHAKGTVCCAFTDDCPITRLGGQNRHRC